MKYKIKQTEDGQLFEVIDNERTAPEYDPGCEVVGRFKSSVEALQNVTLRRMFDQLELKGFAPRAYDKESVLLIEILRHLHSHIAKLDGSNLNKLREMSLLDFVNCYPEAFPEWGLKQF